VPIAEFAAAATSGNPQTINARAGSFATISCLLKERMILRPILEFMLLN
jgi:hypothetical protein